MSLLLTLLVLLAGAQSEEYAVDYARIDISDSQSVRVLSDGECVYTSDDVAVTRKTTPDGSSFDEIAIAVGDGYSFGISDHGDCGREGFGLWVRDREGAAYSWEWFRPPIQGRADKLQGTGSVSLEVATEEQGCGITRVVFLEDTVFRLFRKVVKLPGETPAAGEIFLIRKGSVLVFRRP